MSPSDRVNDRDTQGEVQSKVRRRKEGKKRRREKVARKRRKENKGMDVWQWGWLTSTSIYWNTVHSQHRAVFGRGMRKVAEGRWCEHNKGNEEKQKQNIAIETV